MYYDIYSHTTAPRAFNIKTELSRVKTFSNTLITVIKSILIRTNTIIGLKDLINLYITIMIKTIKKNKEKKDNLHTLFLKKLKILTQLHFVFTLQVPYDGT